MTETQTGYDWRPIADLPADWRTLAATDVQSLAAIWQERRDTVLQNSDALKQFNERLAREWAIETGIIEGLYTIDRGTTRVLIEQGIIAGLIPHGATDKPAGRIVDILNDHQATLEGIFDFIGRQRDLSTGYVKEVHAALTQHQPTTEAIDALGRRVDVDLIRGDWKQLANSPTRPDGNVHQYAPPEHVAAEMDRLIALHAEHDAAGVSPEVEAAWLHHRFTQIHPFGDGNGRVARVLASLVFLRAGWFPLVVTRDDRAAYIAALENADAGGLRPLVTLFAGMQKQRMLKALSLSNEVKPLTHLNQMLEAIRERMTMPSIEPVNFTNGLSISLTLWAEATQYLNEVTQQIDETTQTKNTRFMSQVYGGDNLSAFSDRRYVQDVVRQYGYELNDERFGAYVRAILYSPTSRRGVMASYIIIAFHSIGDSSTGVMVASALFKTRDADDATPIARELFSFTTNETENSVRERFKPWLDEVILLGLDEWHKRL